MSAPSRDKYRPDIDGLRAVAVLSVIFFHAGFKGFPGGFTGVDIFFVISGYLITRLIVDQHKEGRFTFFNFYARRARRILPALLFTLAFTFVGGIFILSPQHFATMAGSLIASLFSVSNFYFMSEVGYFDIDSKFKPLVHTWSLGIEEQFYVVWPLTLIILLKLLPPPSSGRGAGGEGLLALSQTSRPSPSNSPSRKAGGGGLRWVLLTMVGLTVLASIFLAILFADSKSSYYFTPFRVYEFFIGIALVFLPPLKSNTLREILFAIGSAMIAFAVTQFHANMGFPGWIALIPTLGAGLVIYSNNPAIAGALLRNKPAVGIGLISYSLYMIHWPLIVFTNYLTFGEFHYSGPLVVGLSLLAATFMYFFIEQPFRTQKSSFFYRHFRQIIPSAFIALALLSLHPWLTGGWPWRFPANQAAHIAEQVAQSDAKAEAHFRQFNVPPPGVESNGNTNVLIVGDSHSHDLFNAISLNQDMLNHVNLFQMYLDETCVLKTGYTPTLARRILHINGNAIRGDCPGLLQKVLDSPFARKADAIVIANAIGEEDIDRIPNLVKFHQSYAKAPKLIFFGEDMLPFDPPTIFLLKSGSPVINKQMYAFDRADHIALNQRLKDAAEKAGIPYFDFYALLCPDSRKECGVVDRNGTLLYKDTNHWTFEGEKYYGQIILENGFLKDFQEKSK